MSNKNDFPFAFSSTYQLLFAYFTKLFRDEQKIKNDGEAQEVGNNGVDSIPCEGGLEVKRTQVSV